MPVISPNTRVLIKTYLESFIEEIVKDYQGRNIQRATNAKEYLSRSSNKGQLAPFQAALINTY